jgi:hypothetical protein
MMWVHDFVIPAAHNTTVFVSFVNLSSPINPRLTSLLTIVPFHCTADILVWPHVIVRIVRKIDNDRRNLTPTP